MKADLLKVETASCERTRRDGAAGGCLPTPNYQPYVQ